MVTAHSSSTHEQHRTHRHLLAGLRADLGDGAVEGRLQRQLHLHRLQHSQRLTRPDLLAVLDVDRQHRAGHLRGDRAVADGGRAVGEDVGLVEHVPLALEHDLDLVRGHVDDGLVPAAGHAETNDVPLGRELGDRDTVDLAARPVDPHHPVELDQVGRRLRPEPEPVVLEGMRTAVLEVRGDQHRLGPRRHDPGEVVVGRGQLAATDGNAVQPGGVDGGVAELVRGGEHPQEADVGGDAEDRGVVEGVDEGAPGRLAVRPVHDHLPEHRVVRRRDHLPAPERGVDAGPCRPADERRGAGLGQEAVERVLGVDPGLDRVPVEVDVVLGQPERLTVGDLELQRDQVESPSRAR